MSQETPYSTDSTHYPQDSEDPERYSGLSRGVPLRRGEDAHFPTQDLEIGHDLEPSILRRTESNSKTSKGQGGAPLSRRPSAAPSSARGEPPTSARSACVTLGVKGRSVSRSGGHRLKRRLEHGAYDDEDDDDVEDELSADRERRDLSSSMSRARAMSPAPVIGNAMTRPEEDDEVERIDRGEELVRKRMKDRARQKKVSYWRAQ